MNDQNSRHGDEADSQDIFQLTPEEKRAMEALPHERMPSPALEDRLVAALRTRGLIRPSRRRVIEVTAWRLATADAAARLVPRDELARKLLAAIGVGGETGTYRAGSGAIFEGTAIIGF